MRKHYARFAIALAAALAIATSFTTTARATVQVDAWNLGVDTYTFPAILDSDTDTTVALPFSQVLSATSTTSATRNATAFANFQVTVVGDSLTFTLVPNFTVVNDTTSTSDAFARSSGSLTFTPEVNSLVTLKGNITFTQVTGIAVGIQSAGVREVLTNTTEYFFSDTNTDIPQGTTFDYSGGPFSLTAGKQYQLGWYIDVRAALDQSPALDIDAESFATTDISSLRTPLTFEVVAEVPEPASLSLLALGSAALLIRRRR